jgi:hypothetical protein
MFSKTKIALAAALIFGSASAALAADSGENHWESVSGTVARGTSANAGSAYGYAAPIQKNRPGRQHTDDDNR